MSSWRNKKGENPPPTHRGKVACKKHHKFDCMICDAPTAAVNLEPLAPAVNGECDNCGQRYEGSSEKEFKSMRCGNCRRGNVRVVH